ncbi:hypothetical protein [Occallatibacter riparius]|uniref:Uncharacterized protein n=1 Tax=Occallatibacter riparius TaxID=1002689 RepID=A0A9J7BJ90_9BACT|nr:hypothetical protein [Occallatibacter riparius]UWZ82980.1 hypothetical protein MOP44_20705 [Occallatibacter riparius]
MTDPITPADPHHSWWKLRWTRVFTALCVIVPFPVLLAWYLQPWYSARQIGSHMLALHVEPARLHDTDRSPVDPERLRAFEYSFQSPWGKVDTRKDLKHATIFLWNDGPILTAFEPVSKSDSAQTIDPKRVSVHDLGLIFVNHGYNSLAAELNATPEQIHWWDRSGSARLGYLLAMKELNLQRGSVTYKIENEELRGFQFSDHAIAPFQVTLELFDVNGRRYELTITSPPDSRKVTQADINALVASFRPIPHS